MRDGLRVEASENNTFTSATPTNLHNTVYLSYVCDFNWRAQS